MSGERVWNVRLGCMVVLAAVGTACGADVRSAKDWHWKLGAGGYGILGTDLDVAQWDWVMVTYPGPEAFRQLERAHHLNPRQKCVMRLVGVTNHLGDSRYYWGQASFLDYYYKPGVKAKVEANLRKAVRATVADFKYPDTIFAYTFLEELPGCWGCGDIIGWAKDMDKLPRDLERYREPIEKERGQPLVWCDDTRLWVGRKFAESVARLHRIIKQASGGKMIIYWHHGGYATIDELGPGQPLATRGVYPFRWGDVVKPGLCEGIMLGSGSQALMDKRYLPILDRYHWPYFKQLSHPSKMRLIPWSEALSMAHWKRPENLGYMFFCEGSCNSGRWNDDPSIPPEDNVSGASIVTHRRRFCAQQGIGRDVVHRALRPRVQIETTLSTRRPGNVFPMWAVVTNRRDMTWYLKRDKARLHGVKVRIELPPGLTADPRYSAPVDQTIGDMHPAESRIAEWWVTCTGPIRISDKQPVRVTVTADDAPTSHAVATGDSHVPGLLAHEIMRSGESWQEPGFALRDRRPWVEMIPTDKPVRNPGVTAGQVGWTYNGVLHVGHRLVIPPTGLAVLYAHNILPDAAAKLADPKDPTGFKCWSSGYGVFATGVHKYVRGGTRYRVTLSGKSDGGAQSRMDLRFLNIARKPTVIGVLEGKFGPDWKTVSVEVKVPDDANLLQYVYLARRARKGRIWYGQPRVEPADIPTAGLDVRDRVTGQALPLRQTLTRVTYRDASPPTHKPKMVVRLFFPDGKQK